MEPLLSIALTLLALVAVGYPIWKGKPEAERGDAKWSDLEEQLERRREILADLRELDLDHELGRISDEDYTRLRERYRRQASDLLN